MELATHSSETLETESASNRSPLSHRSRDLSSASVYVPSSDMKTLDGSSRSSRLEALDDQGLVPTSPVAIGTAEFSQGEALGDQIISLVSTVVHGSSLSSHSEFLADQSGRSVSSLAYPDEGSMPLQAETLDNSLTPRFLARDETLEREDLMLSSSFSSSSSSRSLFLGSNSSSYSSTHWSSTWSWDRETKPPSSLYPHRDIEPSMVVGSH